MTHGRRQNGDRQPLGRTLYDIAQVLESAEGSEERVRRALELLRQVVPYERCALLDAPPGLPHRLVIAPFALPSPAAAFGEMLGTLLAQLVDERPRATGPPPGPPGTYLAVPLVGLDRVIGILFVESPGGAYVVRHLRSLSMVGAKLAAYLTLLRAPARGPAPTAEREEARAAPGAAERAKDDFLALVSEELKRPATAALEAARVLGSGDASEVVRIRALERIEGNLRAQSALIDDLIDLSHIAAGDLHLDRAPIEPARWINAAVEELRPDAERRSIRLIAALDESVKPLVVDPRRLGRIITGLLTNALQSTPGGGRVEVRLERAGCARIQVIDDGVGIRPEALPRIFERFRRANGASPHTHGGLGIGLAIVKGLVELHGGRVYAESKGEGKGTTFTVELPLGPEQS